MVKEAITDQMWMSLTGSLDNQVEIWDTSGNQLLCLRCSRQDHHIYGDLGDNRFIKISGQSYHTGQHYLFKGFVMNGRGQKSPTRLYEVRFEFIGDLCSIYTCRQRSWCPGVCRRSLQLETSLPFAIIRHHHQTSPETPL